ncbi:response regulator [Rhizobium sp. CFBP 13726]|uniref:response regulator n=1 Tax=Rhizobium/Agrobacterium group TaxID=227290 RepID=UPI0017818785|nr:response regulator [Rhizobium sp. CFBP 13726]MBD8649538.1 response regulator [Rhizobium sp. CFBP 13726]
MNDLASADADIQTAMMEVISEAISGGHSGGLVVYDKNDLLIFAGQQLTILLGIPDSVLAPGTRLRDLLGAIYDGGGRFMSETGGTKRLLSRDDWISDNIAALWKERHEALMRRGADRWISLAKRRLPSGYGVCILRDVSEQRKREEQWRADMERVQLTEDILDNLPFPVMVKDTNLAFVAVNKAACRFHDLPAEALLGCTGTDIHAPALAQRLDGINRRVVEDGEEIQLPERLTRPDGSQMVIVANKYRIGKPGRYYLVTAMQDISRMVEVEEDGRGFIRLFDDPNLFSAKLHRKSKMRDALQGADPDIAGSQILIVSSDPLFTGTAKAILADFQVEASSVVDEHELALCLELVSNAAVRVDLIVADRDLASACRAIGSNYDKQVVAFDAAALEEHLVPTLSRELTKLRGPVEQDEEDNWQILPDDPQPCVDILVAEDNEVNQIVFSQILESLGYRYAIAVDGEEVVRMWHELRPSLVLMDVTLPTLNGFEAARAIRTLEEEGQASTPIVGVLAQAFDRDREECFASGMDDVILKPISPDVLETLFAKFLVVAGSQQMLS